MAIQMISAKEVQLIRVIDLRPIDFQSGKRLAIPTEECNVCDRCEKLHVKVYEVLADGILYKVGSGCCKRLFGWEPAKKDVQDKEKRAEEASLELALKKAAQSFLDQINTLEVPRPKFKGVSQGIWNNVCVWHADGVVIASKPGMAGLDAEKRAEFAKLWRAKKLEQACKEYEETYKANRSEAKRARQLIYTVKQMNA